MENERTYVYIDYITEGLGLIGAWNNTTRTLAITNPTAHEPQEQPDAVSAEPLVTAPIFPETEPDDLVQIDGAVYIPIPETTNELVLFGAGNWMFTLTSYGLGVPVPDWELFFYEGGGLGFLEPVILTNMSTGFESEFPGESLLPIPDQSTQDMYLGVFDLEGNALLVLNMSSAEMYPNALGFYKSSDYGLGLSSNTMVKHHMVNELSEMHLEP